ncbi:DUF1266 domain-containing protein [Streptomyces sp. MST-110588]|uniref:DUF1266 domain-containing protein n=1 Tax=Streptomyces sp. MST-110588 TaxID=2833628 RepID=UPI001F5D08F5|nr:DUF1266 domain-containing protein [Streptomyces sp. MST-110588]UNO38504.1 DUF1266 domain-containing protein [Streptomyces sp. MST-110588]
MANGWIPPTDVELDLYEAKSRGDWDAYKRVLLAAQTFTYVLKEDVDELAGEASMLLFDGPDGDRCFVVHTRGQLPEPRPGLVQCSVELLPSREEDEVDEHGRVPGLLVNPGTPAGAYFPGYRGQDEDWDALAEDVPRRGHDDDELITKYSGPLHGPLAHGLACGTHLAVHNQVLWNDLGDVYSDYRRDVEILRDSWDVTDRQGWLEQLTYLLEGRNSPPLPEFALMVRREIARRRPGAHTDPQVWRQVTATNLRQQEGDEETVAEAMSLIGQIVRYESRFRADGILPPDGYVVSALGYDFGRAVNFARWGLGARFAERAEAEKAVIRAGELCRMHYSSWQEFSAGYILGRALRFDEESFGHMYSSALSPHRILMKDLSGPWHNIPFQWDGMDGANGMNGENRENRAIGTDGANGMDATA